MHAVYVSAACSKPWFSCQLAGVAHMHTQISSHLSWRTPPAVARCLRELRLLRCFACQSVCACGSCRHNSHHLIPRHQVENST
jgi:hypothetical protein